MMMLSPDSSRHSCTRRVRELFSCYFSDASNILITAEKSPCYWVLILQRPHPYSQELARISCIVLTTRRNVYSKICSLHYELISSIAAQATESSHRGQSSFCALLLSTGFNKYIYTYTDLKLPQQYKNSQTRTELCQIAVTFLSSLLNPSCLRIDWPLYMDFPKDIYFFMIITSWPSH